MADERVTVKFAVDNKMTTRDQDAERWRDIPRYPRYQVSNYGSVRNIKTGRVLKVNYSRPITAQVSLSKNNKAEYFVVARLVAEAFLDDYDPELCVWHKDKDPHNNVWFNLYMETIPHGRNHKVGKELEK
jgi:hypothetical protein